VFHLIIMSIKKNLLIVVFLSLTISSLAYASHFGLFFHSFKIG
jgi:hypothetical protein